MSLHQGGPVEILPFLYLGSAYHASKCEFLANLHITALLNVSRRTSEACTTHLHYKWIPVEDSHTADISSHFQEAIDFIGRFSPPLHRFGSLLGVQYIFLPFGILVWLPSWKGTSLLFWWAATSVALGSLKFALGSRMTLSPRSSATSQAGGPGVCPVPGLRNVLYMQPVELEPPST